MTGDPRAVVAAYRRQVASTASFAEPSSVRTITVDGVRISTTGMDAFGDWDYHLVMNEHGDRAWILVMANAQT